VASTDGMKPTIERVGKTEPTRVMANTTMSSSRLNARRGATHRTSGTTSIMKAVKGTRAPIGR